MLPGTAANTNTVPGRAPQTAEASKLPGSILHTTELGATHAALHFEQTPLLSSTVDINDHLIQVKFLCLVCQNVLASTRLTRARLFIITTDVV